MRLGIDMDGVIADFNSGWIELHRNEFGSDLHVEMVQEWDGLHELGGFADMEAFWAWARTRSDRPSVFRHLQPFDDALDTLHRLDRDGHHIVIITAKPRWSVPDTLRWLADHEVPTGEIHFADAKHEIGCDVYLDDAPHVLADFVAHRPDALICRFIRPWNAPMDGVADVDRWSTFHDLVTSRSQE